MDDGELIARHRASQHGFYRSLGTLSPGGRVVEAEGGVLAAVVPARPDRSVFNAVVYAEPAAVLAAREELAQAYAAAGVHAWTVWVQPEHHRLMEPTLEAAGHRFDGQPMRMAAAIEELDLAPRADLDLDPTASWAVLGGVNDAAYGLDPLHSFADAFAGFDDPQARVIAARRDGEPAAVLGIRAHEGDCLMIFVATLPVARGGGLASELMRTALRAGRDELGCTTTSLEATAMGESLYARLGYRRLGRLHMWELRTTPSTL